MYGGWGDNDDHDTAAATAAATAIAATAAAAVLPLLLQLLLLLPLVLVPLLDSWLLKSRQSHNPRRSSVKPQGHWTYANAPEPYKPSKGL